MELADWIAQWTNLANYPGTYVPDVEARVSALIDLCTAPVSPDWPRPSPADHLWKAGPYRRADRDNPDRPERVIEREILGPGEQIARGGVCFGGAVIDGINAIPLTLQPKVEADVLLLVQDQNERRLYLTEVKSDSNNAWYAIVELLRQMRLFSASAHAGDYFHRRDPQTPSGLPLTGLVLAPAGYYTGRKKQGKAVARLGSSSTRSRPVRRSTSGWPSGRPKPDRSLRLSAECPQAVTSRRYLEQGHRSLRLNSVYRCWPGSAQARHSVGRLGRVSEADGDSHRDPQSSRVSPGNEVQGKAL